MHTVIVKTWLKTKNIFLWIATKNVSFASWNKLMRKRTRAEPLQLMKYYHSNGLLVLIIGSITEIFSIN